MPAAIAAIFRCLTRAPDRSSNQQRLECVKTFECGGVSSRARVAKGPPRVTSDRQRRRPGRAPLGAMVSVRHRARGNDRTRMKSLTMVARLVVDEHARCEPHWRTAQRELTLLRAKRADFSLPAPPFSRASAARCPPSPPPIPSQPVRRSAPFQQQTTKSRQP